MRRFTSRSVGPLLAAALLGAACGGSDGAATSALESQAGPAAVVTDAPVGELVDGFNTAGFDLLRTQPVGDNLVFSPASIGHALLMARAAADDTTGSSIDAAFGLPEGIGAHDAWNSIAADLDATNGTATDIDGEPTPTLTLADRLWPDVTASPDQTWVDLMASHHGADVSLIDRSKPEASRAAVNDWVSQQTQGLIPDLLPEGFIDGNTVLVLTDTVYFAGEWQTIFGKYGEVDAEFTRLDGSTVPVSLLRDLENSGRRGLGDGYAAATLPYKGGDVSMTIVVPDEGTFEAFRDRLDADLLAELDAFEPGPYELLLPRWETTSAIDLMPWLADLGAAPGAYPAIDPAAELSGAVHGADIAVDEYGTVAAAATALGFAESGPPEPEFTVAADRPFYYLIRHEGTGLVLFAGQVTAPTG